MNMFERCLIYWAVAFILGFCVQTSGRVSVLEKAIDAAIAYNLSVNHD